MGAVDLTETTSGLATLAGLWAVVAPYLWPTPHVVEATNVLLGIVVAIGGAHTAYRAMLKQPIHATVGGVSLVAGALLIALPLTVGYGLALLVTDLVAGVLIAAAPLAEVFAGGRISTVPTGGSAV